MNRVLEVVFGLDGLRPGDEGVRFGMTHDLPLWVWMPIVVVAVLLGVWSYWRLEGPAKGRLFLALSRGLLLVLLAALAAGPRLMRENESTVRDSVVVLLDRSASMTMPDAGQAGTREAQLRIVTGDPVWEELAGQHDMLWLGFDAAAYELREGDLGEPVGARTRLGAAVEDALARLSGRPISGVVVVTDGRTSDAPDARLLRELTAAKVGVYPVPLGSERALLDLAIEAADAPTSAFVDDIVPVTVRVAARGDAKAATEARVVLIDAVTGVELDAQPLESDQWRDGVMEVRLVARPEQAGPDQGGVSRWLVRVESRSGDVIETNNERTIEVELIDRPLRVVYFEGYPRWEYRYVKDLLVRESSVRSSVMLLATDRRYIQEGNVALSHVPRSSGEWSGFDVVVIGDVRPDVFSREQLEQLRDHVALRGGGLVWVAGPGSTPWSWASTPLGDLLPFVSSVGGGQPGFSANATPVTLQPEAAAARLGVLEMGDGVGEGVGEGWLDSLSDASMGWPVLRWSISVDPGAVKATAVVLASSVPTTGSGGVTPCVLTMRYGAGRVVFVGPDEVWRWRYARGEALPERFYLPLVRLAGRGSLSRSGRSVVLEALPGTGGIDTPVRIRAVLLDQSLVDAAPQAVEVRITRKGETARTGATIKLGPEGGGGADSSASTRGGSGGQTASYAASWVPGEPGEFVVETVDPLLASAGARAACRALAPDDELRTPEADHGLLVDLAARTGGVVVLPGELGRLAEVLPNRSVVVAGEPEVETLWDKPVVLAVLVLLLAGEWVGRRLMRLV